ncbi:MAG: TIGR00645 family protein [Pseudolabrys sp.]|nr:TIGR00645 family protein [Pseudolabrys sp.]MBV9954359.1 TIGR00645 family protein [Pseudolabrys sp.]
MARRGRLMKVPKAQNAERAIEHVLFNSRWLMAPFYLGLTLALVLLLYHFIVTFIEFASQIIGMPEHDVILSVLTLIDLSFTGNLLLIVVFSGYENFVSRIDVGTPDRPVWMTKIDFSGLKQKLMASIVAISAIQVLKAIMELDEPNTAQLGWLVGIHITFVFSLVALAVADRISAPLEHPSESPGGGGGRRLEK